MYTASTTPRNALDLVLPRHATVDTKVDGVGQEDARVDEHRDCVCDVVVDKVEAHAGIKSL